MKIQRPGHAVRARRPWLHAVLCLCSAASALSLSRSAHADISSWAFVGGGASRLQQTGLSAAVKPAMRLEIGVGSPPSDPFVLGGLFALEPTFGYGSDLALLLRGASRSYVNGNFGIALDLGPYQRFWGEKSTGGEGTLWLGAPWGLALGINGSLGSHDARGASAILGIDFARLTVYRNSGTSWFLNPFPAYRPKD